MPDLPRIYKQAYYLDMPEGCRGISLWEQDGNDISLPFFTQPTATYWNYYANFYSNTQYNYVIFEYLDDDLTYFHLDGIDMYNKSLEWPGWYSRGVFNVSISRGKHNISLWVRNGINIGGVGQVLLCKDYNLHEGVDFIFPPEEII